MILDEAFTLEIDLMIGCTSGVQKEFFATMKSHLKPIEVQPCSAIFDKKDCAWIKRVVQPKQCYRNAYKVGEHFEFGELKPEYVEGKVLCCGLSIDHAWVKIGDIYIDPTFEYALGKDVSREKYAALQEFPLSLVRSYQLKTQVYGDIYRQWLLEQIRK